MAFAKGKYAWGRAGAIKASPEESHTGHSRAASTAYRGRAARAVPRPDHARNGSKSIDAPRLPPPLGPFLRIISSYHTEEALEPNGDAKIKDCIYVASYNWLGERDPTILVPGMPPAWSPPTELEQLKPDQGSYFRDQNAARFSSYPMQPAIEAIFNSQQQFDTSQVDLFACDKTLGNLLNFTKGVPKPFSMVVGLIGQTVFFVRREESPRATIPPTRSFGHTMPEAFTFWDRSVKNSESHQRIVSYQFGGMQCCVRFGVDGYFSNQTTGANDSHKSVDESTELTLDYELGNALRMNVLDSILDNGLEKLAVKKAGQSVAQSAIFHLKTRAYYTKDNNVLEEELDRIWVTQIPNFILAFHEYGLFNDIRISNVRADIDKWETDNSDVLRKFAALLHKILILIREKPNETFEIRHDQTGVLELGQTTADIQGILPPRIESIWINGLPDSDSENGLSERDEDN